MGLASLAGRHALSRDPSFRIPYDTTRFVEVSIREVVKTLAEAMALVVLVVFIFLQNWRATLIPVVAVPVSLIGTFAGLLLLGYSINTLTLFGMVLAIGIVVDDAIVVLENVERIMHEEHLHDTQDGLYTTVLRGLNSEGQLQTQIRRVSCVQRELDLARHHADFLALARNPDVRFFVSNTTEAGIAVNTTDRFDDAPAATFPAKLTRWLFERYRHFAGDPARGVALLPCELIEANGAALRAAVQHYVALWELESGFATWLDQA